MLIAIGKFIPALFGQQVSARLARAFGIVILVVAAALVFEVAKYAYNRSVINRYKVEQAVIQHERDQAAEAQADLAAAKRTVTLEKENEALEAAATEAAEREPEKARTTVGPVTQSYYDTLRKGKK